MEQLIKNIPHAQPIPLAEQVQTEPGKVVSRTLAQQPGCGITLFAFDAGESISTHAAPGDAMTTILEGTAEITIDGTPHILQAGQAIVMQPAFLMPSKLLPHSKCISLLLKHDSYGSVFAESSDCR